MNINWRNLEVLAHKIFSENLYRYKLRFKYIKSILSNHGLNELYSWPQSPYFSITSLNWSTVESLMEFSFFEQNFCRINFHFTFYHFPQWLHIQLLSIGLCNPQHWYLCWVDILVRKYLIPIYAFSMCL